MRELTRAEEEVMQVLWKIKKDLSKKFLSTLMNKNLPIIL